MAHIIIDGYNFIRQSASLAGIDAHNLEAGRKALLARLSHYQKTKGHDISVVFDAAGTDKQWIEEDRYNEIHIIYSQQGETADSIIIHQCHWLKDKALIVSSDKEILRQAKKSGCSFLTSIEFEKKLNELPRYDHEDTALFKDETEPPKPIHKRWATKKKGPSKRLPKAKRKALSKL